MRKLVVAIACVLLFVPLAVLGQNFDNTLAHIPGVTEAVVDFSSKIDILPNSHVRVVENITYDFGTSKQRHGIFRTIPYAYSRNAATYKLRIKIVNVWDPSTNVAYPFTTSRKDGSIELKIGDAEVLVSGVKQYAIAYEFDRGINFFNDHDELYWNVTGTDWEVPIIHAAASVSVAGLPSEGGITTACYTGPKGSTAAACEAATTYVGTDSVTATTHFSSSTSFGSWEGLTIVFGVPKNVLAHQGTSQEIRWFLGDNWFLGLPIVVWILLHIYWLRKGRDPKLQQAVIPEYEAPDGLRPGEVGTVWDEKAETKDVSATLIDLAVRGFIKIRALEKNKYEFIRLQKDIAALQAYEKELLDALFMRIPTLTNVELKTLKNKFYKDLPGIQKQLYESCVTRGYFSENPNTIRNGFRSVAGICAVVPFFLMGFLQNALVFPVFILIAILLAVYGQFMPRRTHAGVAAKIHIQGFKWFLSVTETERLKFHNAPEKKPEQFEQLLPYAMVLGVESEWAKQFADIYTQQPGWYEGPSGSVFNAIVFTHAMSSLSSNMGSTFTSHPTNAGSGGSGFGGGGFSGGGFGGGGGGSW